MSERSGHGKDGTLPGFTECGVLPQGDFALTLTALHRSMLVESPGAAHPNWDGAWRATLVDNLGILARQLWSVGVREIFVDGSFVEDKDHPNDIDGYFVCDRRRPFSGELERELNLLDPHKCWTWDPASRRWDPDSGKAQLPMWRIYRVELYPHYGQICGIRDARGHELEFPSAFRQSRRDSLAKGIVKLVQDRAEARHDSK
ncbi:MAG: hypothetical protein HZA53_17650 [Planctomycetes bacterium]|nr:hypothetical protein [Planctomycetota bacterium]